MVKIALEIKANLENINEIKTSEPDFRWYFKFTCSNCGEQTSKWNYISQSIEIPAQHGKDIHHFLLKCKQCSRVNTASIVANSIKPYRANDQKFTTMIILDCRGLEPSDFSAREGWIAKAVDDGTEFKDLDLSEGEWVDYCDKIKQPVGIYSIEHKFVKVK